MNKTAHLAVTDKAFDLLSHIDADNPLQVWKATIIEECGSVDNYTDVMFIKKVAGTDEKIYKKSGHIFTRMNHYIDIKNGSGSFDDYDGYSYKYGSASADQHQMAEEVVDGDLVQLLADIMDFKVDEGFAWYFNDAFVSHNISRSPAIFCYSFPKDKGDYTTKGDEMIKRFPEAEHNLGWRDERDKTGIPFSVFMPVDNLARYWYWEFLRTHSVNALGPVLHAIQDASIPHHAAGYHGNYHSNYESDLDSLDYSFYGSHAFENEVKELYDTWNRLDVSPPRHLKASEWSKVPAVNWSIDQLVTWVALNAYNEYDKTYNHFRNGYEFNRASASKLTIMATAMCLLLLKKAAQFGLIEALQHAGKKPPVSIQKAFPSDEKSIRARIHVAPRDQIYHPMLLPVYLD